MTVDGQRGAQRRRDYLADRCHAARQLPPGQNTVIVTTMRTPAFSPGDPELRTTPGVFPNEDVVETERLRLVS